MTEEVPFLPEVAGGRLVDSVRWMNDIEVYILLNFCGANFFFSFFIEIHSPGF